jgi:putative SOS response-associated peptidase YedK
LNPPHAASTIENDGVLIMCYSAKVQQNLHTLARRFGAQIDWAMFEEIFHKRLSDDDIRIAHALEDNFDAPASPLEQRIHADIATWRQRMATLWESDLFRQKQRLAAARRALALRDNRKAREEERIASTKITAYLERLSALRGADPRDEAERIFPRYYVPIVVRDRDRLLVRPMRYQCRLAGKPASYDARYPGTYNARRDNLQGFWADLFGAQHGVMVVKSFYENVPSHLYEKRTLAPGEKPRHVVLHFNPQPPVEMLVPCLWSHWRQGDSQLYSFAAITDEPPAEIAATGHTRCIISLRETNVAEWLDPSSVSPARLESILGDRQRPFYEHRIAA